jgi:nitrite reductase/ring-hydroxylating ferredoxin subunit/alkylhydroperoxidase/carboxymuconolactone decarboxylase family protein YurZ
MSKALTYLVQARPEAMGHYFKFLKDAGKHLDPKTRSLISVITKVHAQTAPGLLQYVRRAMNDGATSTEILDALLMAFPALGLSKIVWAVDVLLENGVEGFETEASASKAGWHRLGSLRSFAVGKTKRVECEGRAVFVYRTSTAIKIYDGRCPHQRTVIPLEALDGRDLKCPKHGWTFDVRSGKCTAGGDRPLHELPGKTERGALYARW